MFYFTKQIIILKNLKLYHPILNLYSQEHCIIRLLAKHVRLLYVLIK